MTSQWQWNLCTHLRGAPGGRLSPPTQRPIDVLHLYAVRLSCFGKKLAGWCLRSVRLKGKGNEETKSKQQNEDCHLSTTCLSAALSVCRSTVSA